MAFIALNEDNSHFFGWHPSEEMTTEGLNAWLDQYAGTQVRELVLCMNSQRSSVASKARQTVWDGYDPESDNDQPFFAGVRDKPWFSDRGARAHMRTWVHNAWLLHAQGLDPYAHWIARCRHHGIAPWLSMRMNDVHYVDQPEHCIHDDFWKKHPEFRRDPEDSYNGQCLDYALPAVREYAMDYLVEMVSRYDMDGFELDWMRNPYHFRPGHEGAGCQILSQFVAEVRSLLNHRTEELGHPIQLGVRVPGCPETALGLGYDAATWAREGMVDRVVVTPFLHADADMPVGIWKHLLAGSQVTLAAGLMCGLKAYLGGPKGSPNLELVRGLGSVYLDQGADLIYLFNFMDNYPWGSRGVAYRDSAAAEVYRRFLRQIGSADTMHGMSRRHVVTVPDTSVPGVPVRAPLPVTCDPGASAEIRIPCGPLLAVGQKGQVRLGTEPAEATDLSLWEVRVNRRSCAAGVRVAPPPEWSVPTRAFAIPDGVLHRGYNLLTIRNGSTEAAKLTWAEVAVSGSNGEWPDDPIDTFPFHPRASYK